MDRLIVDTTLTLDDWRAYCAAINTRMRTAVGLWVPVALVAVVAGITIVIGAYREDGIDLASFVFGAGMVLATLLALSARMRKAIEPAHDGMTLSPSRFVFDASGFTTERSFATGRVQWTAVREIELTTRHVFLWLDKGSAYIVPLRDLPYEVSPSAFVEQLRAWAASARASSSAPPTPLSAAQSVPPGTPPQQTDEATLFGTAAPASHHPWRTFARMLVLLPADITRIARDERWFAGLVVLTLALWLGLNRWLAGPDPLWYPIGFTGIATCALVIVFLGWLIARLTSPPVPYRVALLNLLAFLPAMVIAYSAIEWLSAAFAPLGALALSLLGVLYVDRSLRRLGVARPINAVLGVLVTVLLAFLAAYQSEFLYARVWYENYESSEATENADAQPLRVAWQDRERVLFEQADRIDEAVANLASPDPARPDVFFVGFAGYAYQKVFAEEIKLARDVVGQRYGSWDRSLLLVNDQRDIESAPLATVSGLRRALAGIAGKMDLEQDILFLALSSHGSDKPTLSVQHHLMPFAPLTADALKSALDDAGVRWRVIVISACHSGAFIEPLKDENTIILTAAASDRTSFGCSDERDLTYFGEAFFRDALPDSASLREAFESAREAIAAREAAEGMDASQPQAWFGQAIQQHWESFEAQLSQ